jgi:hypothetical protein
MIRMITPVSLCFGLPFLTQAQDHQAAYEVSSGRSATLVRRIVGSNGTP